MSRNTCPSGNSAENASVKKFDCGVKKFDCGIKKFALLSRNSHHDLLAPLTGCDNKYE